MIPNASVCGVSSLAVLLAAAFSAIAAGQGQARCAETKEEPAAQADRAVAGSETLAKRRVSSETLPLFNSAEPFEFTLATDFKALNKDRNPESTKRFPGELRIRRGRRPGHAAGAAQRARPRAPNVAHV